LWFSIDLISCFSYVITSGKDWILVYLIDWNANDSSRSDATRGPNRPTFRKSCLLITDYRTLQPADAFHAFSPAGVGKQQGKHGYGNYMIIWHTY
jgi:hypothetical protein